MRLAHHVHLCSLWMLAALPTVALPGAVYAYGNLRVLVSVGDAAPDGAVITDILHDTSLSDDGRVGIFAHTERPGGGAAQTVYSVGDDGMVEIAKQNDFVDATGNTVHSITSHNVYMSPAGKVYFRARLSSPPVGTLIDYAILSGDGGPLSLIARAGDVPPGARNYLSDLSDMEVNATDRGVMRDGSSGFLSSLTRFEGGNLFTVMKSGDPLPNGIDQFGGPTLLISINDRGSIHIHNRYFEGRGSTGDGLYVIDGETNEVSEIVREGQVVPGVGTIERTTIGTGPIFTAMTNDDEVAFGVFLANTLGGEATDFAVLINRDGVITKLVQECDSAPDGNGKFARMIGRHADNAGRYFLNTSISDSAAGELDDVLNAIYDDGQFEIVVREGQEVPNGNGVFSSPNLGVINGAGQWAFLSSLRDTELGTVDNAAVFLYDGSELHEIARKGQRIGNRVVDVLYHEAAFSINDRGDVAILAQLDGGQNAILLWSIPEPSTVSMVIAGLATFLFGLSGRHKARGIRRHVVIRRASNGTISELIGIMRCADARF